MNLAMGAASFRRQKNTPWWLLAGLTSLNILSFADRYLLLSFSPSIIADLKLSRFEFTLLTGFVFIGIYSLLGLAAGVLADRLHRPRLIAGGVLLWSVLTAATALTSNFSQAVAVRLFIGVGEAVLTPAALTLLADRMQPTVRARAFGVYYLGLPAGIGASFTLASVAGPALGWRGSFLAIGLLGMLASIAMLFVAEPRGRRLTAQLSGPQAAIAFRQSARDLYAVIRTTPSLPLIVIGAVACVFVQGASALDLVWWTSERGYSEVQAQRLMGGVLVGGGIVGVVLGGIGADFCRTHMHAGRLKFLAGALLLAAPAVIGYRLASPQTISFAVLAFCAAAASVLIYGPVLSTVQELVPMELRGSATASVLLCTGLIGGAGGAAAAGWLADLLQARGIAEPVSKALLWTLIPGAIAAPAFLLAALRLPSTSTHPA